MTETAFARNAQGAPPARPGRRFSLTWLGLVPFLIFSTLFLLIPTAYLIVGSFVDSNTGEVTLQNYARLTEGLQLNAYLTSIEISSHHGAWPAASSGSSWRTRSSPVARGGCAVRS